MRLLICILLSWAGCATLLAADYENRFQKLEKEGSRQDAEELLVEWREAQPNNPESWISSANHYFNKGIASVVITSGGERDDGTSLVADRVSVNLAIGFLREGVRRFPARLDIRCGLSYILEQAGEFDKQFSVIKECVTYSKEHSQNLLWLKGKPLPLPSESFLPPLLDDYANFYMEKSGELNKERFLKLEKFFVESYPKNMRALLRLAVYYEQNKDWDTARNYYRRTLALSPNSQEREEASIALDRLNQNIR
jgi:tetratricopeptide (TPR) repeat protein